MDYLFIRCKQLSWQWTDSKPVGIHQCTPTFIINFHSNLEPVPKPTEADEKLLQLRWYKDLNKLFWNLTYYLFEQSFSWFFCYFWLHPCLGRAFIEQMLIFSYKSLNGCYSAECSKCALLITMKNYIVRRTTKSVVYVCR